MIGDPTRLVVRRHFARLGPDELAPFRERPTSFVADASNGRGVLDPAIKPLDVRMRFAGSALTVNTGARDNLAALASLDFAQPSDVLVFGAGGHTGAACVGDILVKIAKAKGVAAIVTDGAVRDVDDILPLGLPVFCRAITPSSAFPSGPGEIGLPMALGSVAIEPGDLVMSATCRICFFEWVRALRFQGRNADMAMVSICKSGMAVLVRNQGGRGAKRTGVMPRVVAHRSADWIARTRLRGG